MDEEKGKNQMEKEKETVLCVGRLLHFHAWENVPGNPDEREGQEAAAGSCGFLTS